MNIVSSMDWHRTPDHDTLREQIFQALGNDIQAFNKSANKIHTLNPSENNQESALKLANRLAENGLSDLQDILMALINTACAINEDNTVALVKTALTTEKIFLPEQSTFDKPEQRYENLINLLSTFHSIQSFWPLIKLNETNQENTSLGWLNFLATHLLSTTNIYTEQEKEVLLKTCQVIAAIKNPTLQHALGQMLSRQLESPQSTQAFINTLLTHFSSNPCYGIVFLHGLTQATNAELNSAKRLMAHIDQACPNPATGNIHEGVWILMASSTIERKTKANLLNILSAIEPENIKEFSEAIANSTAIVKMCLVKYSSLAEAYQKWLPACNSLANLNLGAHPSRTFLLERIEQHLITKCFGAHSICESTDNPRLKLPIAVEPLHLTTTEKIAYIQKTLPAWIAQKDSPTVFFEKIDYAYRAFFEDNAVDCRELQNQHKTIQEIINTHNNTEDKATIHWLNLVTILALGIAPEVLDKTCMAEALKNIAHIRDTHNKLSTTQCWLYITQNATWADNFEKFKEAHCPRVHTERLAPALFILSDYVERLKNLQVLLRIVQNSTFKDGKKMTALLGTLNRLALNNVLSAKEKCLIIQKATAHL